MNQAAAPLELLPSVVMVWYESRCCLGSVGSTCGTLSFLSGLLRTLSKKRVGFGVTCDTPGIAGADTSGFDTFWCMIC